MGWNSLLDSQPPERGRYLVYHWYQDSVREEFWDGCKWKHPMLIFTHWMPLPERPKDADAVYRSMGHAIDAPDEED